MRLLKNPRSIPTLGASGNYFFNQSDDKQAGMVQTSVPNEKIKWETTSSVNVGQCRRPQSNSWVRKFPWRRNRLPTPVFLDFLGGSDGKESACNVGDLDSILGLGRSPGGGHGNPQYSCLENPMVRGAWWATVHGVAKSNMTEQLSTAQHEVKLACDHCCGFYVTAQSFWWKSPARCFGV